MQSLFSIKIGLPVKLAAQLSFNIFVNIGLLLYTVGFGWIGSKTGFNAVMNELVY